MRALPKMTIGRFDALLVLHQLGLEQLELHAHRAQLLAQQEVGVGEGEPVGALRAVVAGVRDLFGLLGVFLRRREVARRCSFAPGLFIVEA